MNSFLGKAMPILCGIILSGAGGTRVSGETSEDRNGAGVWMTDTITATVVEVKPDSGMITIQGPQGDTYPLVVDSRVDLGNLNAGDRVEVVYALGASIEFRQPTQEDRENPFVVEGMSQGPQGTNPQAGGLRQIRALVRIENVDRANRTVTVKGPQGNTYDIYVVDQTVIDRLQQGTELVVVYTEGLAMSVTRK